MSPFVPPSPGYQGPTRPYHPGYFWGNNTENIPQAMQNLMADPQFQAAFAEEMAASGNNPNNAHEQGIHIYYNPNTGEIWLRHKPGPALAVGGARPENSVIDPGRPPARYPGGWVYLGFAHTHPFPPAGPPSLGPPGSADVRGGQPNARPTRPWYIMPSGGGIFGVWNGTIIVPPGGVVAPDGSVLGGGTLKPGEYQFGPNGGLIPLVPLKP